MHGLIHSIVIDHGAEGLMCNAVLLCWIVIPFAESAWHLAAWAAAVQRHPVGRLG